MDVRHNTALLEKAVDLVVQRAGIPTRAAEAAAAEKQARAVAKRRLATGAAVALAAVGLGLGVMLGLWRPELLNPRDRPQAPGPESPRPEPREAPRSPDLKPATIDYSKFARQEVKALGRTWTITAGHHYATDSDPIWTRAWCYTRAEQDGVSIQIDLVERPTVGGRPKAPVATRDTLAKVGIDDDAALELSSKCPWLDGRRFDKSDFEFPDRGRTSPIPLPRPPALEPLSPPQLPTSIAFIPRDGFDAMGGDLPNMPLRGIDFATCEEKCRGNPECIGYTFNKTARACFLKSRVGSLFTEDVALTGFRSDSPVPPLSKLKIRKKTGMLGEVLGQLPNAGYVDCALACDKSDLCRGFLFTETAKDGRQCVQFRTYQNDAEIAGAISGVKSEN